MRSELFYKVVLVVATLLLVFPNAFAQREILESSLDFDQIIINSQNWQDIFQGLLYGKLIDKPVDFLIVQDAAVPFVSSLDTNLKRVLYIAPSSGQQYQGLDRLLERQGFVVIDVPGSGSIALRLAKTISPDGIIVTDERYPYNSITLAPYAIARNEFVIFADSSTIEEVDEYLSEENVPVTVFGIVDSSVSTRLSQYSPLLIDKGGKFENNIFIAEEFLEMKPGQQVVVTNGEFIEVGLIDDFNANVFVGNSNVPTIVEDFFVDNDIIISVLVGNYLSTQMSKFKDDIEGKYDRKLQVFVRFAKTPRQLEGQFSEPQALEFFPFPIINPDLEISSVAYNRLTKKLEITYYNPSLIQVFFSSSLVLKLQSGESMSIGDAEPQSIVAGQSRTILYEVEDIPLSAEGLFLFGDYPLSQEYSISTSFDSIPIIDIADDSQLIIEKIVYDKLDKAFYITLSNPSDVLTYAQVELVDVIIDGVPKTIGTKDVFKIPAGESETVYVRAELQSLDIIENSDVLVRANYGERKQVLFKQVEASLELSVRTIKTEYIISVAIVVSIIIFMVLFGVFFKKSTYYCDRCGQRKQSRTKLRRHNCGGVFRKN